jgi:hypothetical protein
LRSESEIKAISLKYKFSPKRSKTQRETKNLLKV